MTEDQPARRMAIEMTLKVRNADDADEVFDLRVYVMDLFGDEEAHRYPITVSVDVAGGNTEATFDLTPLDAAALRDFLDLLVRTKPWLPSRQD